MTSAALFTTLTSYESSREQRLLGLAETRVVASLQQAAEALLLSSSR